MADSDGRDETGSSSGKTRVKDSQLEDHNQQPAAINTPNGSREEEEEAGEHQEAEPTVQETNRDASTGGEKEEIKEDAEKPLLHGEMIKKRKTDHEDGSGVATLITLAGADLPGAQTGRAAMPIMMGRSGLEALLGGGGVSESAAADRRSVPRRPAYKFTYRYRVRTTFITGQAEGAHGIQHTYAKKGVAAGAANSLDHNAAAAANRGAEEPPPRPAGQDDKGALPGEDEEEEEEEEEEK